ncbi:mesenteric estrogen-dependent adipogenesis protein-like [Osmerus mordax]|uniref:mesenteric estrogen-dependent adipogenesis protein-like n=1 Tax=Osmerus mordax TaxID=8014 RepID=UPI00350F5DBA
MTVNELSRCKFSMIDLEDFLRNPPRGFKVETRRAGYRFVRSDPEICCVLIDDFESCKGKVMFQHSTGKTIKVHNLRDYTTVRKSLTSKRFYLLVSACENKSLKDTKNDTKVLQRFVVVIDGSDPFVKWELDRGLDWTISSVAGESYRVDVDFSESLKGWLGEGFCILANGQKVEPTWRDTSFTLKYYSDALFDIPHWLGFSKRKFKITCCGT